MGIIELFFLGLGLSMDAAAISISNTLAYPHLKWKAKLSMPVLFALFQGIMPILGYYASGIFATFIDTYAGFVAFFILCFIGGKMIIDVVYQTDEAVSIPQYTWRQGCNQPGCLCRRHQFTSCLCAAGHGLSYHRGRYLCLLWCFNAAGRAFCFFPRQ